MKLSRDVTVNFRGYNVTAKAGTKLELVKNASGTHGNMWAIPAYLCDAGPMGKAGKWSIFGHDSMHYYIWAPIDAICHNRSN